jgi:hypothetical protein
MLNIIISHTTNDIGITHVPILVFQLVKRTLEKDPKMKGCLASQEEFCDNVAGKGEKNFINSLRAMAANNDTQGSKAWDGLYDDGTSFPLGPSILIESSV